MTVIKRFPVLVSAVLALLLAGPVAAETGDPAIVKQVETVLSAFDDAKLDVQWRDGVPVLAGKVSDEAIDPIVVAIARVDGISTIVNNLHMS